MSPSKKYDDKAEIHHYIRRLDELEEREASDLEWAFRLRAHIRGQDEIIKTLAQMNADLTEQLKACSKLPDNPAPEV